MNEYPITPHFAACWYMPEVDQGAGILRGGGGGGLLACSKMRGQTTASPSVHGSFTKRLTRR